LDATTDTLARYASLAPLARDVHDRGTFAGADRELTVDDCVFPAGAQRVRIGAETAYATDPRGVDELTGRAERLRGHYGVLYRIVLPASERARDVVIVPRAGAYGGAARVNGNVVEIPGAATSISDGTRGVFIAGGADELEIELMPSGGSSLPIDLVVF
jgi:hypothetical protein